jgi:hydroxymethylpyrimidine/phosphomethylpyrimidine kinase
MNMRIALSIAGSDPTGGAGLQADLQVFHAFGVHGAGVVTALTVQDTAKVHQVLPAFPNVVLAQLRVLLRDLRPDAVKIGMLASDDVARSVELGLRELDGRPEGRPPLVIDPVLAASEEPRCSSGAGGASSGPDRATVVTPNLWRRPPSGCDVSTDEGIEAAACALVSNLGAGAALVKGGHREGAPRDLLALREGGSASLQWLDAERIDAGPVHGTGCALASAIAAGLANGETLVSAVEHARRFVAEAIRRSAAKGRHARLLAF